MAQDQDPASWVVSDPVRNTIPCRSLPFPAVTRRGPAPFARSFSVVSGTSCRASGGGAPLAKQGAQFPDPTVVEPRPSAPLELLGDRGAS